MLPFCYIFCLFTCSSISDYFCTLPFDLNFDPSMNFYVYRTRKLYFAVTQLTQIAVCPIIIIMCTLNYIYNV